jgi:hypothetical protein
LGNLLQFGEDSRLKGYTSRVTHAILPLERTYCTNCGRPWGWASEDSSEHIAAAEIVVFCEDCFEALNARAMSTSSQCRRAPLERIPQKEMKALGLVEENIQ